MCWWCHLVISGMQISQIRLKVPIVIDKCLNIELPEPPEQEPARPGSNWTQTGLRSKLLVRFPLHATDQLVNAIIVDLGNAWKCVVEKIS